jgi:hypothetical protein
MGNTISLSANRSRFQNGDRLTGLFRNALKSSASAHERTQIDGVITTSLKDLRHDLEFIIEIAYGLLDVLTSMKILTQQQVEAIRSKRMTSEKISQLLDFAIEMSPDQQRLFLEALENTQQSHVVAYVLRGGGNGLTEQNWPLFASEERIGILDKHRPRLIELLDPGNGLVDELLSMQCINNRQRQAIEALKTESGKSERILAILRRRSVADFFGFVTCLQKTKQHQVVSLLAPDMANSETPLCEEKQDRIRRNYPALTELIDCKNGLLAHLLSVDCITWRQKMFIESASSQLESNQRLLDIIRRGSESDFNRLLVGFLDTQQSYVHRLLFNDSAVPCIQAKLENAENTEYLEKRIVEQFMTLLAGISDEHRQELRAQMNLRIDELRQKDAELFATATGHSVHLYFFCRSLPGLWHLYELYSTGHLRLFVEDLFDLVLGTESQRMAKATVSKLLWDMANYSSCLQHLTYMAGLLELPIVYQLAQQASSPVREYESIKADLYSLPFELIEIILMKAAGQLFGVIGVIAPRAEIYTVTTFCSVSSSWRLMLTSRRHNKRLLRQYFKRVCHPFKCNPTLSLRIDGEDPVWGVAEFNGKLYIARGRFRRIEVFTSSPPFTRLDDMLLPGLAFIQDIAVCSHTCRLYVADSGSPSIVWRLDLSCCKQAGEFATIQKPSHSLSVNCRHLLVVPSDGNVLFVYGDDGSLLNQIELPCYMKAQHAVETSLKTYIVSHRGLTFGMQSSYIGVSELDVNGQVVRSLSCERSNTGPVELSAPYYMALDGNDHVIVADHDNKCVVLLKSDLRLRRVLISSLDEHPFRLCLSSDSQLNAAYLFVAYAVSPLISVLKLK